MINRSDYTITAQVRRRTLHNPTKIPSELRALNQWVCWRYENRHDKLTKVPIDPHTGARASVADCCTWTPFRVALESYKRSHAMAGIGFVITTQDRFVGVDLDHVIDGKGTIDPIVAEFTSALQTYAEISPSGRGLRIFAKGELPATGCRRGPVEMYSCGRFLTVTGDHWPNAPTTVEDCTNELAQLHQKFITPLKPLNLASSPPAPGDDAALLDRARRARNGELFLRLFDHGDWKGCYYPSQSEADAALCALLAFWCGNDPPRIDRMFRQSALMRPKWDARRGAASYGAGTIAVVLRRR